MKHFRRIFIFVLALVLLGIVSTVKWREPWYHWKPLSSWLAEYGAGPADYKPSPQADNALRQIGSNAVPYLLNLLHSTNSHSYYTFVGKENQRGMYPVWTPRASTVWEHLTAWSVNVRSRFQRVTVPASWNHWKAYLAFQAMGPEGKSAIPDLVKLANDPSNNSSPSNTGNAPPISFWKDQKWIRIFAAQSSTYLPQGTPVIPISILMTGGGYVPQPFLSDGEIAAWSLAAIGADSVPPLMEMLTNSNPQIRCRAAMAFGLMGKPAEPAVSTLIAMLHDPDRNTRREAADALGCIGQQPDLVIPALIKVSFDDKDVESAAIISLGALGERATNAIAALLALFSAEYNSLDQTSGQYRMGDIALALNKISPEVTRKEVIPLLTYRIQNPKSPWNQSMTLNTLGQMTNHPDLVIPVLFEALDSTADYTRSTTVYQLGNFGPAATSAIPKLISFTTNQDTNLCRLATNALDKIKPGWRTSH
jgi:HEAT repeat protein